MIKLKILVLVLSAISLTITIFMAANNHILSASHPEQKDFHFSAHQTHSAMISFRPQMGNNITATGRQVSGRVPVYYQLRQRVNSGARFDHVRVRFTQNNNHGNFRFWIGNQNALRNNTFHLDIVRSNVQGQTVATAAASLFRLNVFFP